MTVGRLSWHLLYHRDISSMAIHVAMAQPNSTYKDACQPNRSASKAKIVGANAFTRNTGVARRPNNGDR